MYHYSKITQEYIFLNKKNLSKCCRFVCFEKSKYSNFVSDGVGKFLNFFSFEENKKEFYEKIKNSGI